MQPEKATGHYPQAADRASPAEFPTLVAHTCIAHAQAMTVTEWYHKRYRSPMAMNLRLPPELAQALRDLADQTGRSQQDLAREALEEYVRDYALRAYPKEVRHIITPARYRPGDPRATEAIRATWADVDTAALLAALQEDREQSRW